MSPNALRNKMKQLGEFISDAEGSVRTGKIVDMAGLDRDVTVICQQAATLPPGQAAEIQPDMADLIGRLERLAIALRDFKENAGK